MNFYVSYMHASNLKQEVISLHVECLLLPPREPTQLFPELCWWRKHPRWEQSTSKPMVCSLDRNELYGTSVLRLVYSKGGKKGWLFASTAYAIEKSTLSTITNGKTCNCISWQHKDRPPWLRLLCLHFRTAIGSTQDCKCK